MALSHRCRRCGRWACGTRLRKKRPWTIWKPMHRMNTGILAHDMLPEHVCEVPVNVSPASLRRGIELELELDYRMVLSWFCNNSNNETPLRSTLKMFSDVIAGVTLTREFTASSTFTNDHNLFRHSITSKDLFTKRLKKPEAHHSQNHQAPFEQIELILLSLIMLWCIIRPNKVSPRPREHAVVI